MSSIESCLFHVIARLAAERLTELAPEERRALSTMINAKQIRFPRQASTVRMLCAWLPDAEGSPGGDELWDRARPKDAADELHRPVSHGVNNTAAEAKVLERLTRSPGKIDSMRDRVLRTLLYHHSFYEGAMTNNELAVEMATTRDHVHPRIMELEKGGWIQRLPDREGRNGVLFAPTLKAMTWYEEKQAS